VHLSSAGKAVEPIRLRAGSGALLIPGFLSAANRMPPTADSDPVAAPLHRAPDPPVSAAALTFTPIIALVEAVPARADELAAACLQALAGEDRPGCAVALDGANRLGERLGCPDRTPAGAWHGSADLAVARGRIILVPAPADEAAVDAAGIDRVLAQAAGTARAVVVDLGCRWVPRLFRPVFARATHIWLVTRSGQWTGVEMRLEQAEFSGWTDMRRIRVVAIGPEAVAAPGLGVPVAAVLPEPGGAAARAFVLREVGRGQA
jgi:hypothetical protein